jgi:two-component sensor histidine kinase
MMSWRALLRGYHPLDGRITFTLTLGTVALEPDRAIPCGLLLNELLSNRLKHAFPIRQTGEIHTALRAGQEQVTLSARDTGVGFPEGLDFRHTHSLRLQLVYLLTEQLGGTITPEGIGRHHLHVDSTVRSIAGPGRTPWPKRRS